MNVNGVTVVADSDERKKFVELPYQMYKGDEHWVPPLRMDQKKLIDTQKNPFFENAEIILFYAEQNGKPAGRIAAIIDHRFNDFHNSKTGHFGFFECINDQSTADLLFKVAEDWLRDKGMEKVIGPASPSMMDTVGILVEGFEKKPYILMPYNKEYYPKLFADGGFDKEMGMFAYVVREDTVSLERIQRAGQIVLKRNPGLKIRPVNLKKMDEEAHIIREIFNKAWAKNWGFIPLSKAEMDAVAKDLKMILDPDLACIAEVDGKPIAFSVALPDYNQVFDKMNGNLFPLGIIKLLMGRKKINRCRTALMGVLPEYQGKGIDALLHQRAIENGPKKGITESELSWILETNTDMIRVAEKIGGVRDKTYFMYSKKL
jgi:GNAT superfamily N-acetyltransferase